MMCGSCSNENAFKMMNFVYMDRVRGGRDFNQEEMSSCMVNQVRSLAKQKINYLR